MTELTQDQKIALWVEALRSGEYEQGTGILQTTDNKFCCLGVACKVAEKYGIETIIDKDRLSGASLYSQPHVMKWFGLRSPMGSFLRYGFRKTLSNQNDEGASFSQIADIIESKPKGLFV